MNYYEHHIGDYDKNTSHLTACEDGIYSRLLRRYYDKEKPLPADTNEVKRLARARARDERAAVDAVLAEFFLLEADGWHHKVCDEVIASFQAGEPEREAKKKNEDTRLARHRAERAELFAVINGAGQHMAWNAPIGDVRAAVDRIRRAASGEPATPDSRSPATPPATGTATPATATQTPLPTPHSPLPNVLRQGDNTRSDPEPARATSAGTVCKAVKEAGMGQVNPSDPRLLALLAKGVTVEHFVSLVPSAQDKRNPWAYLLGAVEGQLTDAAAIATGPSAAPAPPRKPSRADTQAAVLGALTGQTNRPERTNDEIRQPSAIDVESRIVDEPTGGS